MNANGKAHEPRLSGRTSPRVNSLREITISYEGQDEQIVVKPPNLSKRGMFINTARVFPEGAVLNLRFSLLLTCVIAIRVWGLEWNSWDCLPETEKR
jgi:hypothetical protein